MTASDSRARDGDGSVRRRRPPVDHPAISIVKNPDSQTVSMGGTATFRITVTNTGDVVLHDVTVTDPLSPNCNRSLGTMAVGAARTYTCTRPNVTESFLNRANVVGTSPKGEKVRDTDTAPVKTAEFKPALIPAIMIVKSPNNQRVKFKATAHFLIKVTNTGREHAPQRDGHRPEVAELQPQPRHDGQPHLEDVQLHPAERHAVVPQPRERRRHRPERAEGQGHRHRRRHHQAARPDRLAEASTRRGRSTRPPPPKP